MRLALAAFFTLLALTAQASAASRVALVVGNAQYQHVPRLANAQNDAKAIAALLRDEDFAVEEHQNLSNAELRLAMRSFVTKTRDADVAVVYFAGHGIEVDGINYLIPTDAKLATDLDAQDEALSLDRVLQVLEPARRLRLVILDACRDNPFIAGMRRTVSTRAVSRGLAQVEPSRPNTLIAFAAKAGSVAQDGDGDHSPFTEALLAHLAEPGLDVRLAFGRVRDDVVAKTRSGQEPFVYGSLGGSVVTLSARALPAADKTGEEARRDFAMAQKLGTVDGWDAFLARHKDGYVTDLARKERERIAARTDRPQNPPLAAPAREAPRIGGTFGADDRARVAEAAQRNEIKLPPYEITPPEADVAPGLRRFLGVWASRVGYSDGAGRQVMIIATSVTKDGSLRGLSFGGPPSKTGAFQHPAYTTPFTARIVGNKFAFRDHSVHTAELARDGRLALTSSGTGGPFKAELEPLWLAADPSAGAEVAALTPQDSLREAEHNFDQTARARVSAIATRHKLPMPDYAFNGTGNVPDRLRRFIGVWASTVGFNGGPVQGMVIITAVGEAGDADGHYMLGASPPGSPNKFPARNLPLRGLITDNNIAFSSPRASIDATLTASNTLKLRVVETTGRVSLMDLLPVWTLNAGLHAPAAAPAPAPPPTRNAPKRQAPAPTAATAPATTERAPEPMPGPGRGMRGGGGRGAIMDSPRFPMCSRMASQRGLNQPTPERRQFVRTCVLNG
jgi:hypothetical protein